MKVKLIGYTQPTKEFSEETEGAVSNIKELVAYCARVSNPSNQMNSETSEKLLDYLLRHKHFSPFEMANATLEIETTRDIARQLLRHRSFKFQEFSQRYSDVRDMDDTFVVREARMQDTKNRQNSIENVDAELQKTWAMKQTQIIHEAKLAYEWAIANGIAKEQARCVLPEGNTMSRLYVEGDIRSWIHYVQLRSGPETQKEHREVAREVAKAISKIFPMVDEFVQDE